MATLRMLGVVAFVCLVSRANGESLLATWASSSSGSYAAGTTTAPVTSGLISRSSGMTGSGNSYCYWTSSVGYLVLSGVMPTTDPGSCDSTLGYKFTLETSATAPINVTRLATGYFGCVTSGACSSGSPAACSIRVCSKSSFSTTSYLYHGLFTLTAQIYGTGTSTLAGAYLNPGASLEVLFSSYGVAYYAAIGSINVYGQIGCTAPSITGGTSSCPGGGFVGGACTVSCPIGYFPNGNKQATCTEQAGGYGSWSPALASTCQLNTTFCPTSRYPPNPGNGTLQSCVQSIYGTCSSSCNTGYTLTTAPSAYCQPSGQYNGSAGACTPTPSYCTLPGVPTHGSRDSCSQIINGNCFFSCASGYIIATPMRTCVAGGTYSGSATTCTLDPNYCAVPPAPGNGTVGTCGQSIDSFCNFQCNTGFIGNGLSRQCLAGGTYSGSPATCTLNTTFCPLPPAPGNGSVVRCDRSYLGTCSFNCSTGYVISASTRTCQADGTYSGSPVTCTADGGFCPVPSAPLNGNRDACLSGFNEVCHFSCNPGYSINVANRTCLASHNFSLPTSACTLINDFCPVVSSPLNGSVVSCPTSVGATCQFACDTGFTAQTALQWTCQSSAAWLGGTVVCALTQGFCPTPSTTGLNGVWGTCPGTLGSTCDLQCNAGYQLGGANPVCQQTGSFDASVACTKIPNFCTTAPVVGNGTVSSCGTMIGDSCTITCVTGFVGGGTVNCQQSGNYGTVPQCTPSPNFCQLPLAPSNGVVGSCSQALGGVCQFSCSPGFAFADASQSTCNITGGYYPAVSCNLIAEYCQPLTAPENGVVNTPCSQTLGGICSTGCNAGYQASTSAVIRVCQANQQYDGVPLTCSLIPGYCSPGSIANGQRDDCNTTVGSQCEFTCNPGYTPARTLRTCLPSGSYSGNAVVCSLQSGYCPAPPDPQNGRVSASCTGEVQSSCVVNCATGYTPASTTTICGFNGTYDKTDFTCSPVSCGELPEAPQYGSISCTGSTYGSLCTYTCDTGYDLSDSTQRRCTSDRNWSGEDATCSPSTSSGATAGRTTGPDAIVTSAGTTPAPAALGGVTLYAIIGGAAGFLLLLCIVVAVVLSRRRKPAGRSSRDSIGSATIRLDSAQDGNADRVNMMLAARSTSRIGAGAFSGVYKAKMEDDTWVAIKVLENTQEASAQEFHREVTILGQLGQRNHPNVVRLIFFCPNPAAIVTELCDGGSLFNIFQTEKLDLAAKKNILMQVASGMAFLHDCKIVHLDLKPENILRGEGGQFKITDFGTSLILGIDVSLNFEGCCAPPPFVGTPQYSAPERFQNFPLDLKRCDVFSFGAMVWRAFSDKPPFEDIKVESLIKSYASNSNHSSTQFAPPKDMPQDMLELMSKCQDLNFRERPLFDDVLEAFGVQRTRRASSSSSVPEGMIANPVFSSTNDGAYNSMNGSVNFGSLANVQTQGRVSYNYAQPAQASPALSTQYMESLQSHSNDSSVGSMSHLVTR